MQALEGLQPSLVKQFQALIATGHLGQAYVFNGAVGTGKGALAQWLALRLFCQNVQGGQPCGVCAACQRILSHNHPDVVTLSTTARSLKVDDVRGLKAELSKSGVEGQTRVFIIEDAQKLTQEAANSLLKFYEEPVAGVTIILTTTAKSQLLPTILSRAQVINFPAPPLAQVQAQLEAKGVTQADAQLIAQLTVDVAEGVALAADERFASRVEAVLALATQLAAGERTVFVAVQTHLLPLVKTAAEQAQLFSLLALVYQDALNQHYQTPAPRAYGSAPVILTLAQRGGAHLAAALALVLQAQVQLKQNVTFQSDLEQLLLKLLRLQ